MEDRSDSLNDGIIACFELQTELRGEEIAVILSGKKASPAASGPNQEDKDDQESTSHSSSSSDTCSISSDANGITFMELQNAYQSVASQLRFRFGVAAGDRVLICCKGQAVAEIVVMLACIKVGATFVPIDNSWISAGTRLKDIIEDAQPTAAVVVAEDDNDSAVRALAEAGLYRSVYVNDSGDIVQSFSTLRDDSGYSAETYSYNTADDEGVGLDRMDVLPLYILYTSGSTGRPKGVLGTHKGLLNRIAWQWRRFPFLPGEVACRRTPLVFVDSMAEIFGALLSMTPLWCPPKQRLAAEGVGGIAAEANEAGVSRITLLPSQLHQALQLYADLGETWQSLRTVFVSGEECTAGLVRLVKARLPEVALVNLYGSTEVAGDVSYAVLSGAGSGAEHASAPTNGTVPVGEPIDGNYLFVVACQSEEDCTELSLLPDGEVGELMVTGTHLARGYHNNAFSRTAKFIDNPLPSIVRTAAGASMKVPEGALAYKRAFLTGDLAYRSAENGLYYLRGRKDRQVKVRGVRVELEDVERQACRALGIDDGVVVLAVAQDASAGSSAEMNGPSAIILVAVLDETSLQQSGLATTDAARRRLQEVLVPSTAPSIVLTVRQFPRNTTGKLDRKVLQQQVEDTFPAAGTVQSAVDAKLADLSSMNTTELAHAIVRIYTEVLGITAPQPQSESRPQDFFALGGDSVRMIEVLWRLRQWAGVTLKPVDLHMSVDKLAERLRALLAVPQDTDTESPLKRAKYSHTDAGSTTAKGQGYPAPVSGTPLAIPEGVVPVSTGRSGVDSLRTVETTGLSQKWSIKLSKCIDASPLLVRWELPDDSAQSVAAVALVVVGCHGGTLVAVKAETGEEVWTLELGEHIESSAVLDATTGLLFVGTFSGQDVDGFISKRPVAENTDEVALGCLWAIDAATGCIAWHFCTEGEIKSIPVVTGRTVAVGSYDGKVYQLRCADGSLVGSYACGGSIFAAPVVLSDKKRMLVVTTSGKVTRLALSDGDQSMSFLSSSHKMPMFSTPLPCVVGGAFCALLAGTDGTVRLVQAESTLREVWCENLSATAFFSSVCGVPAGSGAEEETAVLGCHDGKLRRLRLETGEVLWECALGVAVFASPFLLAGSAECAVATVAGDIVVVSLASGRVRARLRLPAEVFSSPVCHGNNVYVGCRDDRLYCLQMS